MPFFDGLVERLRGDEIELRVFAGGPPSSQAARKDASSTNPWERRIDSRELSLFGRVISAPRVPADFFDSNGVIVGLVGSQLHPYMAMLRRRLGGARLGVWGHVASYVAPPNALDMHLERMMLRTADQVFAYTPSGAEFAREQGAEAGRVTTVMNSVDTSGLLVEIQRLSEGGALALGGVVPGRRYLAYIGGLDQSKRIDFLAQSLDRLWTRDRSVVLLVAGRGDQESLLRRAIERGQVIMVGYADDRLLAQLAAAASAIVMPGRIGLVAVHALAMGLPILTVDWPYHAPEFEYLTPGESVHVLANDVDAFAQAMSWDWGRSDPKAARWAFPTLDEMVRNFATGVCRMLDT
ncbi:glycosyltransferase [Microbacterium terricola]|uniref:glycosyltransferase n=1 Tax=Microbacterium terricola TaxID=344163 RepID=UPI0021E997E5|nr:glycosyltransferase [Microbacterium terricola]UYK39490.1 glycosyltransferase [Microbacterium terricola]